ncbi:MAG TPA: class I SAM-dependent methyltransferase [Thermoleophilaceae bacterium]|nr:class I SAM-dependent methyltransferase [Thermoleophilaceae bacterium]
MPREDAFDGGLGRAYDAYIKRPAVARVIGRLAWGADVGPMYGVMRAIAAVPDGGTILDAPCGGGLAFRELRPEQDVRYVALDLSEGMLERARREAERRGLHQVELLRGDVQRMPLADGAADLTLSMNSLHSVADPQAAIAELVRCTAAGGRFVGSMLVLGAGRRQDRALRHAERNGTGGPAGTTADLRRWLAGASLEDVRVDASGAIAVFEARRPAS